MPLYAMPSVYDILHTPGTRGELDALGRIARRHGLPDWRGVRCLEPACGSGRLLRLLQRRGARVIGFDRSEAMIRYARLRAGGRGRWLVADMESFADRVAPARVGFAFNLINSIRHLPSDAALARHLAQVAELLEPGGRYVVGISLSRYGEEFPTEDQWQGKRGRCAVHQLVQYLPPARGSRFEDVYSHLTVRRPRGEEHFDEHYRLRCYDAAQWRRAVARSPLRVLEVCDDAGRRMDVVRGDYRLFVLGPASP